MAEKCLTTTTTKGRQPAFSVMGGKKVGAALIICPISSL